MRDCPQNERTRSGRSYQGWAEARHLEEPAKMQPRSMLWLIRRQHQIALHVADERSVQFGAYEGGVEECCEKARIVAKQVGDSPESNLGTI